MNPFITWTAIAVPFDQANIDTNQICPTRFNKVEKGPRYAKVLFHDLRFDAAGEEKSDFVLNTEPYRRAGIIVADRNFGCGSSRESAVFALATFGIRSVIAPSFGEIFSNNCLKNGVLPVVLDTRTCAEIRSQLHATIGAEITVDLLRQVVIDVDGREHAFAVHPLRRKSLLQGLDDISLTEQYLPVISDFESRYWQSFPWLSRSIRNT